MSNAQNTNIELRELEPQPVVSIRATWMIAALGQAHDDMMRALARFFQEGEVQPGGPPFVRYHTFDNGITDLEIGVPVREMVAGAGRIIGGTLPAGPAISTLHLGNHDSTLGDSYQRLHAGVAAHGREARGASWEVYEWINPSQYAGTAGWPDPSEWRTQLVQPVTES